MKRLVTSNITPVIHWTTTIFLWPYAAFETHHNKTLFIVQKTMSLTNVLHLSNLCLRTRNILNLETNMATIPPNLLGFGGCGITGGTITPNNSQAIAPFDGEIVLADPPWSYATPYKQHRLDRGMAICGD